MDAELTALTEEPFVSLTTFRRNGEGVATPVWSAREGDALVVTTVDGSGKVKRIRNNPEITLQACERRGQLKPGAPVFTGRAEVVTDDLGVQRGTTAILKAYGLQAKLLLLVERLFSRGRRERLILRIT